MFTRVRNCCCGEVKVQEVNGGDQCHPGSRGVRKLLQSAAFGSSCSEVVLCDIAPSTRSPYEWAIQLSCLEAAREVTAFQRVVCSEP